MADNGYAQLSLLGTAGGQAIANVLYYGDDAGDILSWTTAMINDLFSEWAEGCLAEWLAAHPTGYTLNTIVARIVNERGVVVSDNAVELAVGDPGTIAQTFNGPAQVAIIRLPTVRNETIFARALKRSYLAIGPLINNALTESGALTIGTLAYMQALADVISTPLGGAVQDYHPVRVGRTLAPAQPAVGRVVDGIVDPFGSFRKSRKPRANGS